MYLDLDNAKKLTVKGWKHFSIFQLFLHYRSQNFQVLPVWIYLYFYVNIPSKSRQ